MSLVLELKLDTLSWDIICLHTAALTSLSTSIPTNVSGSAIVMGALGASGRVSLGQGKSSSGSLGSSNNGTPAVNREQVRTVDRVF